MNAKWKEPEENELLFKEIVEKSTAPIGLYTGRELKIFLANKSLIELWGKGEHVLGETISGLLPELAGQLFSKQLVKAYESGIPYHGKNEVLEFVVNDEIHRHFLNYSLIPLKNQLGVVYGVLQTGSDVSETMTRLQASVSDQERHYQLFLKAPVAICAVNWADLMLLKVNESFSSFTGYSTLLLEQSSLLEIFPELPQNFINRLSAIYQTRKPVSMFEEKVIVRRGDLLETRYIDIICDLLPQEPGMNLQILIFITDVTVPVLARKELEEDRLSQIRNLEVSNSRLLKSNIELEQFAAVAAHDLQEPLRKIRFFVDRLRNSLVGNSAESDKYMAIIENAAGRMSVLIKQILTYSQLSTNQLAFEPVDLNSVMNIVKSDFELALDQAGAIFVIGPLPVVSGVPVQMVQLFTNLLSNSLKFVAPHSTPHIEIHAAVASRDEMVRYQMLNSALKYFCISFSDNGIGFNQEESESIFTVFHRLVNRHEFPGNGIGLALCKKIVDNHQGYIGVHSVPGEGTRFNVFLPAGNSTNDQKQELPFAV